MATPGFEIRELWRVGLPTGESVHAVLVPVRTTWWMVWYIDGKVDGLVEFCSELVAVEQAELLRQQFEGTVSR